jgi:GNAT superfamily N-acetyltransferase
MGTYVELAWVAVIPAHRGKALAHALCASLIAHVLASGYTQVNLSTQDQRLGALETYLQLGFEPVLKPQTEKRWQRVFRILEWPFRAEP